MFMRMLQVKIRPDGIQGLGRLYEERIIPALQSVGGCRYACLMQSAYKSDDVISMTLWQSEAEANNYERTGLFKQLVEEARPFFAESTEWKLQLSEDFTLKYAPDSAEPELKTYSIETTSGATIPTKDVPLHLFLRIVSVHVKPGAFEEYKQLYQSVIIPALLATRGCCYTSLSTATADSTVAISVTLWNSRADANEYERSGTFGRLVQKVSHTLSDLSQWKMESEGKRMRSVTSDDIEVEGFHLIAGKSF